MTRLSAKFIGCTGAGISFFLLTGCVSPQQKAVQQLAALDTQCAAQFPLQPGNFVKRAQCKNAAEDATVGPFDKNPDLYQGRHAERLILAQQGDVGKLSIPQMQLQFSQFVSGQVAVAQQREAVNSEVQLQRSNALANLIVAEHVANPPPAPYYLPPPAPIRPTVTTNCNTFGAKTSCTSQTGP
jgi:hypothetical protein